jgi:N utilization substance protein B
MKRSEVRQQAMQLLYQLDLRGDDDAEQVLASPETDEGKPISPDAPKLAAAAWATRQKADDLATELAEDWPTRRQPPVDRSIIRLAYWELVDGLPPAVVINEAVELAKAFGSERSSSFINGVLDKVARCLQDAERQSDGEVESKADEATEAETETKTESESDSKSDSEDEG